MPDTNVAQRVARSTETLFSTYKDNRINYNDLTHRFFTPVIDDRLFYAQGGADYRTPLLLKAEGDIGDVLTMNPTRLDGIANGETQRARDQADWLRLYCAAVWNQVNKGRWWDRAQGNGQWRHGVKVTRKTYRDMAEPPHGDMSKREAWMRDHSDMWDIEDVETLAVRWYPIVKPPKHFIWEYELPLVDAHEEYEVDGRQVGMEPGKKYRPVKDSFSDSGLRWEGDDYTIDGNESGLDDRVTVLLHEYEDKTRRCTVCADEHFMWSGVEIIFGAGKRASQGEVVRTYSLPWRGSSFMITKGRYSNDRDPDQHFVPFGLPAFVDAANVNWAQSVLMLLASRDSADERVWIEINESVPDNWQWPEGFFEDGMQIERPDLEAGKIPAYPGKLQAWPVTLAPALVEYINMSLQSLREVLPNRFALGQAFDEAKGPATNYSLASQSAALPFGFLLSQSDNTILEDFFNDGILHAMRYWAKDVPEKEQRRYYTRLYSGLNENLTKGGAEDGAEVYLSAERLSTNPKLTLSTTSETLQEQMNRRQQAILGKRERALTSRQFLEEWGWLDVEAQMRLLDEEDTRAQARQVTSGIQQQIIAMLTAELADIDPTWVAGMFGPGQPLPGDQGQGGTSIPGQGVPNVRLPALGQVAAGGAPIGGA